MNRMSAVALALAILAGAPIAAHGEGALPRIVAAENFYGDLARQIAGPDADVTSVLSNPNQDPHDFEADPSTARAIADAGLVIYSGADYDPWMGDLLRASKSASRKVIVVADLVQRKSGDNPHLWYDPATMPALARALAAALEADDPVHGAAYAGRLQAFLNSLQPMNDHIALLRQKYAGTEVTATEPVFGYMADAIGLKMRNQRFQIAVMNGTEPSASDVGAFENDLRTNRVKILFYNSQVADDLTSRLLKIAKESKVPVVGVSETEPPATSYQDWMQRQLDGIDRALAGQGT
jgi:zinc/manganese transport system substrate-binding protein